MSNLTQEGRRAVDEAAQRHGVSPAAAHDVLEALVSSGGGMAQFNHPDLGGMGQWSRGGMIMIGDMFNNALKHRVDALCAELSDLVGRSDGRPLQAQSQTQGEPRHRALPDSRFFKADTAHSGSAGEHWWPADLGAPTSTGSQNDMRYACFPDRRRLALDLNGVVSVYDTGDHAISGFSQQQSGRQSLVFSSQHGPIQLDSLRKVSAA